MGRWRKHIYEGVAKTLGIDLKTPWNDLPQEHRDLLLYGSGDRHITYEWKQRGGGVWKHGGKWEGHRPAVAEPASRRPRPARDACSSKSTCASSAARPVSGQRLNPQARAVRVGGKTLVEVCAMPIGDLAAWFDAGRATGNGLDRRCSAPSPGRCSRRSAAGSASCSTSACTI